MLSIRGMSGEHDGTVDLNLLLALDVLLEEHSATRAADRLGLTQSAVSRILGRLRRAFGDPLLVRTSRGLSPTRRALELAGPLRQAMRDVERLVLDQPRFDPATARRCFRIAAVDYAQVIVLAPLLERLAAEAPLVDVDVRQPSAEAERDLEAGALDLLLLPQQPSGPGVVWTPLFRESYVCVVRTGHPARRLTPRTFAGMAHVLVTPRDRPGGIVDVVLAEERLARRVAVRVPTFLLVPYLLVGTDRVATVPARIAADLVRRHPLRTLRPPLSVPAFTLCQAWHEIHRNDPGHRWLRETVARAAAGGASARATRPTRRARTGSAPRSRP
jgi:DNA-binding transcriptional LysR family regulator